MQEAQIISQTMDNNRTLTKTFPWLTKIKMLSWQIIRLALKLTKVITNTKTKEASFNLTKFKMFLSLLNKFSQGFLQSQESSFRN